MIDVGIEALLIMDKAGIPLLFQKLNPRKEELEPILLSGFLTAVRAFSDSIVDETVEDFNLDYGKRIITILPGDQIIFAVIHNSEKFDRISQVLTPLLKEFETVYYQDKTLGDSGPIEDYEPFRKRIADVMGISEYDLSWIPIVMHEHDHNVIMNSPLLHFINNHDSIQEIIEKSKQTQETVFQELSKLWAYGQIQFRNVLSKEDIVISTNKISNFLQPARVEWQDLNHTFPSLINRVPFLISYFDGKTTVENIMEEFTSEGLENIYWLMDYLYTQGAITILSPEKRRILMAKEILGKSLEISVIVYSQKETIETLRSVLQEFKIPEITTQVKISDRHMSLDYNFLLYDGLSPEKVLKLYDQWLEVLRLFIFSLNEKKRKKYIEILTEELNYEFFEKYHGEDFNGFEEFAFWLEVIFA
ncbi:MAG: hypothetical protein ACTSWD_04620 [Candidatus Heimdallarchaeota archaeon]